MFTGCSCVSQIRKSLPERRVKTPVNKFPIREPEQKATPMLDSGKRRLVDSILVIGGGIAGLAAALELQQQGWPVTLIEARRRLGGRIYTFAGDGAPLDLGAEFIHGRSEILWRVIQTAGLQTQEVPDRHRRKSAHGPLINLWNELSRVTKRIDTQVPDESFQRFIARQEFAPDLKELATAFVNGFHAADTQKISVHALAATERASEKIDGTRSFRITNGYGALVSWFEAQLDARGAEIIRDAMVKTIDWQAGKIAARALVHGVRRSFTARAAIITLPLGVLKPGFVKFTPPLREKEDAIAALEFGNVVKIVLRFRSQFWPEKNFGFIHAPDETIPTWWADERKNILTGWAGGTPADELLGLREGPFRVPSSQESESLRVPEPIFARAVNALTKIFGASASSIRSQLIDSHMHNWAADPFARGAYSYIPVGMIKQPAVLAAPVAGTLFFAGEATATDAQLGTVHGALETGLRAAQEIKQTLHRAKAQDIQGMPSATGRKHAA